MTIPEEALRELLRDRAPFRPTTEHPWDAALWADLVAAGLTGTGLPGHAGGSGGSYADAVALVRVLAGTGHALPLAEQLLVAGPALLAADVALPPVAEPLTIALDTEVRAEPLDDGDGPGRYRLEGTAAGVPWAGVAAHVAVLAAPPRGIEGAVLALADAPAAPGGDRLEFPGSSVPGVLLSPAEAAKVRARYALARAVQVAGGLPAADPELARLVETAVRAVERGEELAGPAAAATARAAAVVGAAGA